MKSATFKAPGKGEAQCEASAFAQPLRPHFRASGSQTESGEADLGTQGVQQDRRLSPHRCPRP